MYIDVFVSKLNKERKKKAKIKILSRRTCSRINSEEYLMFSFEINKKSDDVAA